MTDVSTLLSTAADLRVYRNFCEVRLPLHGDGKDPELTFPAATWADLDAASLTLLGPGATGRTFTRDHRLAGFEGRVVWRRTPGGREAVTLVRAGDLLVQDTSGAYSHVQEADLLFPEPPPASGQDGRVRVTFPVGRPVDGVLTFMSRFLTWSARYHLDVGSGGHGQLRGDATLHHRGGVPCTPVALTLVAGDVPSRWTGHGMTESFHTHPPGGQGGSSGEADPEVAGIARYPLPDPPALPADADVTVPFDEVAAAVTLTAVLTHHLHVTGQRSGALTRRYRLVTDIPLLTATVTVRDQGDVVGEQAIPEVAAGEAVQLLLGREPDVRYRREVVRRPGQALQEHRNRPTDTYTVRYELRNAGPRHVAYEVTEQTTGLDVGDVSGDVERHADALIVRGVLAPLEVRTVAYEVDVIGGR